jgi:hypothetical protein
MKVRVLDDVAVSPELYAGERWSCAFPVTCRLQDGSILCAYRQGKEKHSRDGVLMVQGSTDGGRTWSGEAFTPFSLCTGDPTGRLSFGDPKLARLPDGRVLLWLWAFVHATEETVQAHACVSGDDGRTWSEPRPAGLSCQNAALLALGDGRMILAGNVRVPPEGIRLWCSETGGRSWSGGGAVQMWDARQDRLLGETLADGDSSGRDSSDGRLWESLPGFTFGAPDLVRADDSTCLLTYYAVANGVARVRACRFIVA